MGIKISDMTAASTPLGGDERFEVMVPESDPATRYATISDVPGNRFVLIVAASDETTAIVAGTAKMTFRLPAGVVLDEIRGSLTTAQTSGSIFTVDVNEDGATILSTKLTINNTERTSTTATVPTVISDPSLANDAEVTIDIDQVGDGTAMGLKLTFIGTYEL